MAPRLGLIIFCRVLNSSRGGVVTRLKRLWRRKVVASSLPMLHFTKQTHLSKALPRTTRDLHVYCHGWRDVTMSSAGCLEALEFVQGLIQASL